jgi:hypothetical protein
VTSRIFASSDGSTISTNPVLSLVAGNYTLKVTAAFGDHVGSYSFRLSDLASGTQVTPGNPVSGTLASGISTDLYRVDAQAGDQIALTQQALTGTSPYWRLIDPYGGVAYAGTFGNSGTLTLQFTGKYSLLVEGPIGATGAISYTFNVSSQGHTTIVPPAGTALSLGAVTSGTLSTSGQQDSYVFTIANPTNLYFDSLTNNFGFSWSLIGPQGNVVSSRRFTESDGSSFNLSSPVVSLAAPGTYQLVVGGTPGSPSTGSYSFRLSDLASASLITPSTVVSGTLNPGNSSALYRFTANAGEAFYFDQLSQSGGTLYWKLIDPYGQLVWVRTFSDVAATTLPSTGTYTLLVEGYVANTSSISYSFNAQKLTNPTAALTLGSPWRSTLA